MPDVHALLSASGAHRWLYCTPSAKLEAMIKPTTSPYAEEGTVAHSLAEAAARFALKQMSQEDYTAAVDAIKTSEYYNKEMAEHCLDYAMFVETRALQLANPEVLLEARIKFSDWVPGGFGTADCLILTDKRLEVIDFKYGKGKRVDAYQNPQMRLYALGAYQIYGMVYDIESVGMTIYQPRLSNGISSDEISLTELLEWGEDFVKPRADMAYDGLGDFAPSEEVCRFCRAKATCKARAEKNLALFDDSPDQFLLTVEDAGRILEKASDIKAWLSDLEEYVENALFSGTDVPGWKLVEGRSVRKYADEAKVRDAMVAAGADEALLYKPRKLITLTQLERDFGKKQVAEILGDLIVKPAGKPTLAPANDKRPAVSLAEQIIKEFD